MARMLDPTDDRTVSRLMVAREKRGRASVEPVAAAFANGVFDRIINGRFESGRKLADDDLARVLSAFGTQVDGRMHAPVQSFDGNQGPTRTRPKGEWYERGRVHVDVRPGGFALAATSLALGRKRAMMEVGETCLSWTDHAAERFYERSCGDTPQSAAIGGALMSNFFPASMAAHAIARDGLPPYLAIPCEGGLLLGTVSWTQGAPRDTGDDHGMGIMHHGASVSRYRPARVQYVGPGCDTHVRWRADTYIGPREMRANQVEYAAAWGELATEPFARHMSRSTSRITVARFFMDEAQGGRLIREFVPTLDAMASLLSRTWVQYAMGRPEAVDAWLDAGASARGPRAGDAAEAPPPRFGT